MNNKKSRILTAVIGFFILVIPLIFLYSNINTQITSAQDSIIENLQEKLLNTANKLIIKLSPHAYLNEEFDKIHAELFPEFPDELVSGIPDDSELKKLYNEELFNKLITRTKEKYNPIAITVATQDFNDIYSYFCPELEKELEANNEKEVFLEAKSFLEMLRIRDRYKYNFFKNLNGEKVKLYSKSEKKLIDNKLKFTHFFPICFKYISRFKSYNRNETPIYTDYFEKQNLYPIIKSTLSKNTIHGYYSILVPQKRIDPEQILESVLINKEPNINIELDNNYREPEIINNHHTLSYNIIYPTDFINHIYSFKRLRNIDKTFLLNKQLKLSLKFPDEYFHLEMINKGIKIFVLIATLLFIILSIKYIQNKLLFKIKLSKKLLFILIFIIFLPISGIGVLTFIISHNLNEIIDINVKKNLHNSLENYYMLKDEIFSRRLSSIFEIKKRISKSNLTNFSENFEKDILPDEKTKYWLHNFTTDLFVINDNNNFYHYDYIWYDLRNNAEKSNDNENDKKTNKMINYLLRKYINNLGISKKTIKDKTEILALSIIDNYTNPIYEENSVGKESIPKRDSISLKTFDSSIYFYAKDKINNRFYMISKLNGNTNRPYNILQKYSDANPLWFKPQYKYAFDTNLTIAINPNISLKDSTTVQIPRSKSDGKIDDLIYKIISYKDSGYVKIKEGKDTITNEWIFSKNSPFIIAGTAKSFYNTKLSFIIWLILPCLLTYSALLLLFLSSLISNYTNKPISIYSDAIEKLKSNELGTTIQSFSNDEFDNITKAFNEMSVALKQKEQMKYYISERLIQSVEKSNNREAGKSKLEKVTILSSDIRNFTGISEKYEPYEIVEMLNTYFTQMQQAITENNGIIDKYIGDAIQAVFYDEEDKDNMVKRAAKAAISMRKALKLYNEKRKSLGLFTIENGIGIDTDFAITGTVGTAKGRKDFSVYGEVVSRAANLEAKTKRTTSKILLSKASLEEITPFKKGGCQATPDRGIFNNNAKPETIAKEKTSLSANADFSPYEGESLITNHQSQLVFKDFDEEAVEIIDVRE